MGLADAWCRQADVRASNNQIANSSGAHSLLILTIQHDHHICLTDNLCAVGFMDSKRIHDMIYCKFLLVLRATNDHIYIICSHILVKKWHRVWTPANMFECVCSPTFLFEILQKNEQGELNAFAAGCCLCCSASLPTWLLMA